MAKANGLVGKECPKSLKRKDKEKALIDLINQSFMPLSCCNKRELTGSPMGI